MSEQQDFSFGPFDGELAARVAAARGHLSGADQQILAYLTDSPEGLAFHTAESLSAKAGVSRAAVVRFAKRLGYAGFTDFRTAARAAIMTSPESPLSRFSQAEPGSLVERKAMSDTRNILAAAGLVRDVLGPAAQAIASSRRVLIIGARMSYGLATQLHRLLTQIREDVTLIDPGYPDHVIGIGSSDILIAFLFRRYSRVTVDVLADVAGSGAPVVLITDGRGHPSAAEAKHVLVAPIDGPSLYDSMVAPMWILESLAAEVAAVRPKQSRVRLETVERFTKNHRLLSLVEGNHHGGAVMPETETARARDGQQLSGRWSSRRQWRPDGDGGGGARRWRTQLDPGTGKPFAEVLDLTPAEATVRLERVRASYRPDRLPPAAERAELLLTMARLVEDHADDLGELDALCTGKLRSHATGTAQAGAAILRYYAGLLDEDTYSAELPSEQPGARQFVDRLPVGLAACILPWNVPLSQGCARLAMLFAAGCAGVFKGSELAQPPLLALAELASEAGLPPWAFSVLTGGPEIGQLLTESPLIDAICFTGGISTGIAVAQAAARSLKRVILELGGKTPFVVFADADLDSALYVALSAGFGFQGQACNAGSLLMVEEAAYPEFAARFATQAANLRIGYQLNTDTEVGPMISAAQRTRVGSLVDAALASGARLRAGGSATAVDSGGFFYRPTVLSDVPAGTPMATDEIFGPVVTVRSFTTEDEVISTVNNSPYGLAATVWTTSEERVDRMRASLRTGQLYVNTHGQVPRNTPWGGFRLSGMGRLYGRDGLFAFTEARQTYELGFS